MPPLNFVAVSILGDAAFWTKGRCTYHLNHQEGDEKFEGWGLIIFTISLPSLGSD